MNRLFVAGLCAWAGCAQAQMTPVGLWRSIDDHTGQARAEIAIRDNGKGGVNGKLYKLTPLEGGAKLLVRGYIGPLFRTQVWQRVQ